MPVVSRDDFSLQPWRQMWMGGGGGEHRPLHSGTCCACSVERKQAINFHFRKESIFVPNPPRKRLLPFSSRWAHCTTRPHPVPDNWIFTCRHIVSLWPEEQAVSSLRRAPPAWIKTKSIQNKTGQNNASCSEVQYPLHPPAHLCF